MGIVILDPTVVAEPAEAKAAARLAGLDGKVLGLLANGKVNADRLLDLVGGELAARYRIRDVMVRIKPNASQVASEAMLDELARTCDAVVTAIGD